MKRSRLSRKTGINPVNSKRRKKRYERAFGDYADVIRSLPCDLCGVPGPSDPHHVKSRGAGGTKRHLIPTCRTCHQKLHMGHGPSREHLMKRAEHYWETYGDAA